MSRKTKTKICLFLLINLIIVQGIDDSPTNNDPQKAEIILDHSVTDGEANETKSNVPEKFEGQETKQVDVNNFSSVSSTSTTTSTTQAAPVSSVEQEHNSSMSIFFVLCVIALGILMVHLMLQTHFQYLPESIVIVFLGGLIGLILNLSPVKKWANFEREEVFSPTAFFLILLPPIIFESGFYLQKVELFISWFAIMHNIESY
jgi:hypothetical protein